MNQYLSYTKLCLFTEFLTLWSNIPRTHRAVEYPHDFIIKYFCLRWTWSCSNVYAHKQLLFLVLRHGIIVYLYVYSDIYQQIFTTHHIIYSRRIYYINKSKYWTVRAWGGLIYLCSQTTVKFKNNNSSATETFEKYNIEHATTISYSCSAVRQINKILTIYLRSVKIKMIHSASEVQKLKYLFKIVFLCAGFHALLLCIMLYHIIWGVRDGVGRVKISRAQ